MKKLLHVGKLAEIESMTDVQNGLVVAYRAGNKIHIQNLDFAPKTDFDVKYDAGKLIITVQLNDGEMLAVHDSKGKAEKDTIDL